MINLLTEASLIFSDECNDKKAVMEILEDVNSPVTRKAKEKLYLSVLSKDHIDFDDISKSKGDITAYSGYNSMEEIISNIETIANDAKSKETINYLNIIKTAIINIKNKASLYKKGFENKSEYVMAEYNTYVFLCVEATTASLYSFVEFIKNPTTGVYSMKISNNKMRAEKFFFEQLEKYNKTVSKLGTNYNKFLDDTANAGRSNFLGATAIGAGIVITAAMSIIPITRECIYQIYNLRCKLSDHLAVQANFLEMNKSIVESNNEFDAKKKNQIIKKQSELAVKLRKLSDKIKVDSSVSILNKDKTIKKDNELLSIDSLKDDLSNSDDNLFF